MHRKQLLRLDLLYKLFQVRAAHVAAAVGLDAPQAEMFHPVIHALLRHLHLLLVS